MKSILFVCTGNIFRSLIAEYALKKELGVNPPYRVSSAGTENGPLALAPLVRQLLVERGIDPSGHCPRKLTLEIFASADLAVALGLDHRAWIEEHFGQSVPLFNEICYGLATPVLDLWEAVPDWLANPRARDLHIAAVVDHLCASMPLFLANVEGYLRAP